MGSQELGSDIFGQNPKIPGSLQINLLFTILCRTGMRFIEAMQTFISSEDNLGTS